LPIFLFEDACLAAEEMLTAFIAKSIWLRGFKKLHNEHFWSKNHETWTR